MKYKGISASPGIGAAPIYYYEQDPIVIERESIEANEVANAIADVERSFIVTISQLEEIHRKSIELMSAEEAKHFEAHVHFTQNPSLIASIKEALQKELLSPGKAIKEALTAEATKETRNTSISATDIADICDRLLRNLAERPPKGFGHLTGEVIIVAQDLTPSDSLLLHNQLVLGIITANGDANGAAASMAKALDIPAVVGVGDISEIAEARRAIVDGSEGTILLNPDFDDYEVAIEKMILFKAELHEARETHS